MKKLTNEQFKQHVNKELKKVQRWNDKFDNDLYYSVILNQQNIVYAQGLQPVPPRMVDINGITCTLLTVYNPYAVAAMGAKVAMCVTDRVNQIVVFVDDSFMLLSEEAKRFTYEHELGHLVNQHVAMIGCRTIEPEHQADAYAVQQTGTDTAITALKEIQSSLKGWKYRASRAEITKRIKHIKGGK